MPVASLNATYGCAFIGLLAGSVLYGITLLQTFLYFRQYPKDSFITKAMVIFLWVLDTLHLALSTGAIYSYLVTNYGNDDALGKTTWSMNLQTDCNGLIGLIVECFFARRVWMMSGNIFVTGIIVILACVHFGLGIVFTVEGFLLMDIDKFAKLIWVTSAGLGSAAASDIIIACSLCYYLMKSRTGFQRTDSLITTLVVYSLTTGLITSVIATTCVVTFAIMPTNYVWLGFFWILGKCYVNSFLAALSVPFLCLIKYLPHHSLNSRESLREKVTPNDGTFQLSPFRAVTSNAEITSNADLKGSSYMSPTLSVNVHTQTVSKTDYIYPAESTMSNSTAATV